jgi:C-1 hydroxylase
MSLEENKAMIHSFTEALNNQNLSLLNELMVPDYVEHTVKLEGLERWKKYVTKFLKGFPDLKVTIEDIIAEGDKVWTRVKITGTHKGEFRGITSTGKTITQKCVWIDRISDGKFVESWSVDDNLDFLEQLGVIEFTEKAKKLFPEVVS